MTRNVTVVAKSKIQAIREKVKEKVGLRLALSFGCLALSIGLFSFAVVQFLEPQLPIVQPLADGTYVPSQVVFKVKPGKSADDAINGAVAKPQTLYRNKATGKLVSQFESDVKTNANAYTKQQLKVTKKSLRRVFPEAKIAPDVKAEILRRSGAKDPDLAFKDLGMDRWYVAEVNESQADVVTLISTIKATGQTESVEANGITKLDPTTVETKTAAVSGNETKTPIVATTCANPNDPYSCTSGLWGQSFPDQWGLNAINARGAWSITKGKSKVIIASIDSGVDYNDPELRQQLWVNTEEDINHNGCADYWRTNDFTEHWDCHVPSESITTGGDMDDLDQDGNGFFDDLTGMDFVNEQSHGIFIGNDSDGPLGDSHGARTTGVMSARTDNGLGVAGVCWFCKTMTLRAGAESGIGFFSEDIAQSIRYAAGNGASIINMSFGGDAIYENFLVQDAQTYAYYLGVLMVAAAGNANTSDDYFFPAADPDVLSVGAVGSDGQRWVDPPEAGQSLSLSGSNYGETLDIMAPGDYILTTDKLNGIYFYFPRTGTSLAAPFVSGVAGLIRSANPALSAGAITQVLKDTALDMTSVLDEHRTLQTGLFGRDAYSGYGLVDANLAVLAAKNLRPDFTVKPGISPMTPVFQGPLNNNYRLDITIENYSQTAVSSVPYEIRNATTNASLYAGTIDVVRPGGTWLTDTITATNALSSSVMVVVDPNDDFPEITETNNSSIAIAVPPIGTPYFDTAPMVAVARVGQPFTMQVHATPTASGTSVVYSAVNKPASATFSAPDATLTWTPPTGTANTTATVQIKAQNSATASLATTATIAVNIKPPLAGSFLNAVPSQSFASAINDGKLIIGGPENCVYDSTSTLPDNDQHRCVASDQYNLSGEGIHLDDIQYIRVRFNSNGKWDAPITGTYKTVDDGVRARSTAPGQYLFDLYPHPNVDSDTNQNNSATHFYGSQPFLSTLRFVERDDQGDRYGAAGYSGWPRAWGDWLTECNNRADGAQDKNGLGVRAWSTGTNIDEGTNDTLTGLSFCLIDDSGGSISPSWSAEVHLKSLNQAPIFDTINPVTVDEGTPISFPVNATDPNGDLDLTYFNSSLPTGANFNVITRTFSWTPTLSQSGTYDVTFTASDGFMSGTKTVHLIVNNPPPKLNPLSNITTLTCKRISQYISTVDPSPDPVTYTMTGAPAGATLDTVAGYPFAKTFNYSTRVMGTFPVTFMVTGVRGTNSRTITIVVGDGGDCSGGGSTGTPTERGVVPRREVTD